MACCRWRIWLDDERLLKKVEPWIEWTLNSQDKRGYFGTSDPDWWPRMIMLKVLMSHYEATEDERVLELMTNYFRYQLRVLPVKPLYLWGWGARDGQRAGRALALQFYRRRFLAGPGKRFDGQNAGFGQTCKRITACAMCCR